MEFLSLCIKSVVCDECHSVGHLLSALHGESTAVTAPVIRYTLFILLGLLALDSERHASSSAMLRCTPAFYDDHFNAEHFSEPRR